MFTQGAIVQWWTMISIVSADIAAYFGGKRWVRVRVRARVRFRANRWVKVTASVRATVGGWLRFSISVRVRVRVRG